MGGRIKHGLKICGDVLVPFIIYELLIICLTMFLQLMLPGVYGADGAMLLMTLENLLMTPVFLWLYRRGLKRGGESAEKRERKKRNLTPVFMLFVILGSVFLSRGWNNFITLTPIPYIFTGYEETSGLMEAASLPLQTAASVISAPLLEETLMRGVIYGGLRRDLSNPKTAAVAGALVFAVFHGNMVQGVYAFLMGLFFISVYEACGLLLPAMAAHMAANAFSELLNSAPGLWEFLYPNMIVYTLFTVLFLVIGWYCWKKIREYEIF